MLSTSKRFFTGSRCEANFALISFQDLDRIMLRGARRILRMNRVPACNRGCTGVIPPRWINKSRQNINCAFCVSGAHYLPPRYFLLTDKKQAAVEEQCRQERAASTQFDKAYKWFTDLPCHQLLFRNVEKKTNLHLPLFSQVVARRDKNRPLLSLINDSILGADNSQALILKHHSW